MYMLRTNEIHALAERLVALLDERSLTIATAESCTGGAVSQALTSVAGCSSVMRGAVVAYHNDVKSEVLGVLPGTLATVGAVSEDVVQQMVCGVARLMATDCAIATSGIAGPGGGTAEKPVGTVWVAVKASGVVKTEKLQLCDAGRSQNVANATYEALRFMYETLLEVK